MSTIIEIIEALTFTLHAEHSRIANIRRIAVTYCTSPAVLNLPALELRVARLQEALQLIEAMR